MRKNLQTIAMLMVAMLLMATMAMAQQSGGAPPAAGQDQKQASPQGRGPGAPPDPAARVEALNKELTLTADQQTKIKAIFEKEADQMKPLRENQEMSREDRRAKMMEIRTGTDKAINEVLTPDQQKKYKEWQDKMQQQRQNRGGPGGGPGL